MLLGYVTGGTPRPPSTTTVRNGDQVTEAPNPKFIKWVRNDQNVLSWLFGSLSEDALRSVYGLHTSQEVWFTLAKKYNRVSATRKLDLQRRLNNLSKEGKSMTQYLSEAKAICDQLASIGCALTDPEKIYGVLHGLGQEYESISTFIENSMDTFPTQSFEDVGYRLTNFDDKLQGYNSAASVTPHLAFTAEKPTTLKVVVRIMVGLVLVEEVVATLHGEEGFTNKSTINPLILVQNVQPVRFVVSMVIQRSNATRDLITHIRWKMFTQQWLQ